MTHHVFYDTETTGPEPKYDQVLQAAAILTDDDFVEKDTVDIRSQLAGHIIPTAGAMKVTGVDPYDIARAPYGAYDFACRLHSLFSEWSSGQDTAFAGYNTIRFDEEILRQTFWQNLKDPYLTSGKGRMRMDYLIVARALHARNPDVIDFPVSPETGKKNFKLENIAPLNGFEDHAAHDALGDVRATIHVARLIRDTDPDLYHHMLALGNANTAKDFVDDEVVFQLLGGPMINPGVLDACLIASEATNPKNKLSWNLAIDPTPYLDLPAEEILEAMKKTGTPFKTVKCNKQPGVFPMSWGFLNRVSTDDFAPANPEEIETRAEIIRSHEGFQAEAARALSLRTQSYDAPEHLEEKIYAGFPSWADKDRMASFHTTPDWGKRLNIVRSFEKQELRALGIRTIFLNAPETLSDVLRTDIDTRISEQRYTLDIDRPWTTVGKLMAELDSMQATAPDDRELSNIRNWALETYPIAHDWTGEPEVVDQEKEQEAPPAMTAETPCGSATPAEKLEVHSASPKGGKVAQTAIHYLDGLE